MPSCCRGVTPRVIFTYHLIPLLLFQPTPIPESNCSNMSPSSSKRTLSATCLCQNSTLTFTVSATSLPLPTHFCHCSICRHTHGTLSTIHAPIPTPVVNFTTLTAYASSSRVVRYFCSTCGAHMLDRATEMEQEDGDGGEGQWYVAASLVDAEEVTWNLHSHMNLASTLDGGMSIWLEEINGKKLGKWKGSIQAQWIETGDWVPAASTTIASMKGPKDDDRLYAHCHCRGVEFYISRPGPNSFDHLPQSLTPKDKTKWYASSDVCTSCRLCSSSFLTSWMFTSTASLRLPDGSPYKHVFGTTKVYESSPGVMRTFCGKCGALVVYACVERSQMVDIGVGLLDTESGARAEDWLEWRTHKVSFEEDAVWKGAVEALKEGLRRWGEGEGQEKVTV
ncbi:uncharacterized protein BDR25DRAFT_392895 [Lindgomyces ingoldianus]|uniref:Uncharacterized protein n=1 Tax=Lindgomyces ingoldianus TaxID=673940 RepID=A0ACB6R0C4_9PLEO|nr:uncharacterized protein BDR25DRAFT_392895 [Lindgomyces ingoldianus]KAF2472545.1 hypothetical protein BDR25DRAFT_392895 [Lindgomyces ingoldianus]